MITLYDLPSLFPEHTYSPHVSKTRFSLQYKGIPYTTTWIEYDDIEPVAKKLGVPPTTTNTNGSSRYTLPMIYDDSTGAAIADSLLIAEYLDRTYPDTTRLVPPGTRVLQGTFADALLKGLGPAYPILMTNIFKNLSPSMQEGYNRNLVRRYGEKSIGDNNEIPEEKRVQAWKEVEIWLEDLHNLMKGNVYVMGDTPCFADGALLGVLLIVRTVQGRNSEEWKNIMSWHDGRWGKFIEALEKYEPIDTV